MKREFNIYNYIALILIILTSITANAQKLLDNGDFESGGSGVGFFVNIAGYSLSTTLGTSVPGNYAFVDNPQKLNSTFDAGVDHTTGIGTMMVVDGSVTPGVNFFWSTKSSTGVGASDIPGFFSGQKYIFSYWIKSVSSSVTNAATQANIAFFSPDATSIIPSTLNSLAPLPVQGWQQVSYEFTATDVNVLIRLSNSNFSSIGNDFAIDDMSIVCATPPTLNIIDPATVCSPSTVDLTLAAVTAGSDPGTLTYYTDAAATPISQLSTLSASAITTSGKYYIKNTAYLGCETVRPVEVTILPKPAPPLVTTPISLCISASTGLVATQLSGYTLKWYGTAATGGTASSIATIPTLAGTYYVSQTDAFCESNRAAIVVNFVADNGGIISPFFCNSSSSSIKFDWAPLDTATGNHNFNYTYIISGGATVSGTKPNSSTEVNVTGLLPGQSVTLTINSITEYPCVLSDFRTCTVPCPTLRPTPNFPLITQKYCEGASIPAFSTTSPNGIPGKWNPLTISNTTIGTTKYTFTPDNLCANTQEVSITVLPNETPTFSAIPADLCENEVYELPIQSTNINPIKGSWSPSTLVDTSVTGPTPSYTFIPNSGECFNTSVLLPQVTIDIKPSLITSFVSILDFCAGTSPAPSFPIVASVPPNIGGIIGNWLPSAISTVAGLNQEYQFTPTTQCATTPPKMIVNVDSSPVPTFSPLVPTDVCEGATFTLPDFSNDTPPITGFWETPSGLVTTIDTSIAGTDTYTFILDAGQCATAPVPIQITVNPSNTLINVDATVTDAFTDNQIITVIATATGNYLYQLDSGPLQTSPIFENVFAGTHTITVSDAKGCSDFITKSDILVIKHPKYFTPNGDGFNDTWKLSGLSSILITKIYIFDRYGKLLKEIAASGSGWDGTYLGVPMPADDYWFTVDYVEGFLSKQFKSHFSLKR